MSLTFVTPLGALIALVGLIPLAVLVVEDRRLDALCEKLGLRPPTWRPSIHVGAALIVLVAALAALGTAGGALADQPPGQLGYEGQPGNQGGGGAPGLRGYEGQPGNQGGH